MVNLCSSCVVFLAVVTGISPCILPVPTRFIPRCRGRQRFRRLPQPRPPESTTNAVDPSLFASPGVSLGGRLLPNAMVVAPRHRSPSLSRRRPRRRHADHGAGFGTAEPAAPAADGDPLGGYPRCSWPVGIVIVPKVMGPRNGPSRLAPRTTGDSAGSLAQRGVRPTRGGAASVIVASNTGQDNAARIRQILAVLFAGRPVGSLLRRGLAGSGVAAA